MNEMDPMIGERIGNVVIRKLIGRGGMGAVYLGYQESLDRYVAVKILPAEMLNDSDLLARFRREALSVARLNHPNLVRIYDAVNVGDLHCLIMEYLDGRNLKQIIMDTDRLFIEDVISYSIDIAQGLLHAHSQNPPIIHRDIKTENIIVTSENIARITDFGAVLLPDTGLKTKTGVAIGTPEYMSPEQVRGIPLDFRSDIYSLGIVIWEMLVGTIPFLSNQRFEVARRQVQELPVNPRELRPDVPEGIATIALKAMEKDRGIRYQSAGEVLEDLKLVQAGEKLKTSISYKPSTPTSRQTIKPPRAAETTAMIQGPDTKTVEIDREILLRKQRRRMAYPLVLAALIMLAGGVYLALQLFKTDKIPPVTISDLLAEAGGRPGEIVLTWKAPRENFSPRAQRYEVRMLNSKFGESSYSRAIDISELAPPPSDPGKVERIVVAELQEGVSYHFAIWAYDRRNRSGISNMTVCVPRAVPPAPVKRFNARSVDKKVLLEWVATSDDGNSGGPVRRYILLYHDDPITEGNWRRAVDISDPELISAPPGEVMHKEIEGLPSGEYFFGIRAVDDVEEMSPVASSLKIVVGETRDAVPPSSVADLRAEPGEQPGSVLLSWTAPGDDGSKGRAYKYEVRHSTQAINKDNWQQAKRITRVVSPQQSGTAQQILVEKLTEGQTYYFALIALDEANNQSGLSNSPTSRPTDVAPAQITDLRADIKIEGSGYQITLHWSAPGDDGNSGTATRYLVRYSTATINSDNWDVARPVKESPPQPLTAGQMQSMTLTRQKTGRYYFAIRAIDDADNMSAASNPAVCDLSDIIPPGPLTRLTAKPVGGESVSLSWLASGDDAQRGRATRYEIYWNRTQLNQRNWRTGNKSSTPPPKPAEAYSQEKHVIKGLNQKGTYYFAVVAYDDKGNASPPALTKTDLQGKADTTPPEAVGDLAVRMAGDKVELTWKAPQDKNWSLGLKKYVLKYAVGNEKAFAWEQAKEHPISAPRHTAQDEIVIIKGLKEKMTYTFALRTIDNSGNESQLSNMVSIKIPEKKKTGLTAVQKEVLAIIADYQKALNTWDYKKAAAFWSPDINEEHEDEVADRIKTFAENKERTKYTLDPKAAPSMTRNNRATVQVSLTITGPNPDNPNINLDYSTHLEMRLIKINDKWKIDKVGQ
jgi:serine/threonine protein kinase